MINLGVDVIGTTGQHHNGLVLRPSQSHNVLAALLDLCFKGIIGSKGGVHSLLQLIFSNISIFLMEELIELLHQHLFVQQAQVIKEEMGLA